MLSQLQNWIMRELVLIYVSQWSSFKLIYLNDTVYHDEIGFWFTYVHKDILVIAQGCIGING